MAQFEITSPEGDVYEVTAPEGATEKEALDYAKANYTPLEQTENIESATEPEKSESYKGSRLDRDAEGNAIGTWDETPIFDPVTKTNIPRVGNKLLNKIIPQPKKIPAQLKRQLGLTVRGGVEGLSKTGDFFGSPVRGVLNLGLDAKDYIARGGGDRVSDKGLADLIAGDSSKKEPFRIKTLTEAVVTPGLNYLGVPYAEDSGERISQSAIELLPLTGGVNTLAKLFRPRTTMGKNIQKTFVENQGRQLTSAGIVGGSQQFLEEKGVGIGGQIGWSLALGMFPFVGMKSSINKPIYKDRNLTKKKIKKADDLINNYEYHIAQNLNDGLDIIVASKLARDVLNISPTKLTQTLINTDREIPTFLNRYGILDNKLIKQKIETNPAKGYEPATGFSGWVSDTLSPVSTIIKKLSEPVGNRLRLHDFSEQINMKRRLEIVKPFLKVLNEIKKSDLPLYNELERNLDNGYRYKVINTLNNLNPKIIKKLKMSPEEITDSFANTNKLLDTIFTDLKEVGVKITRRGEYFPRKVDDLDGYYARLGIVRANNLKKLLDNRAAKLGLKDGEDGVLARDQLGSDEVATIINNSLKGQGGNSLQLGKPGYSKGRTAGDVTEVTQPYYQDAVHRLPDYIKKTQREIELRKFFGSDVVENEIGKIDMYASIGKIMAKEKVNLSEKSFKKLSDLLQARLIKGVVSSDPWVGTFKDITYLTTIANPYSAVVQSGDISQSANQTSLRHAVRALVGKKIAKLSDVGLDNVITAEIQSESRLSSKVLDKGLGVSGFKRVDKLGKETTINAAWNEARDLFSPKVISKAAAKNRENSKILFRNKWGKVYGDEYQAFETALKSGELTDNVRLFMWHKLSDTQPISLSEMPLHYLNMKNGRAFYALLSFTIKQLDIMKRTIIDEAAKGNVGKATVGATRYAAIVGGGNTVVELANDVGKGRNININEIPQKWLFNILKNFGISEYAWDKSLSHGSISDWGGDLWMPPGAVLAPVEDAMRLYHKAMNKDEELTVDDFLRFFRKFPPVGSPVHHLLGEGAEKYNERMDRDAGLPISDFLGIDPIIENPINLR